MKITLFSLPIHPSFNFYFTILVMEDLKEVCANTLAIPCTSAALIHSSSITELQDII